MQGERSLQLMHSLPPITAAVERSALRRSLHATSEELAAARATCRELESAAQVSLVQAEMMAGLGSESGCCCWIPPFISPSHVHHTRA